MDSLGRADAIRYAERIVIGVLEGGPDTPPSGPSAPARDLCRQAECSGTFFFSAPWGPGAEDPTDYEAILSLNLEGLRHLPDMMIGQGLRAACRWPAAARRRLPSSLAQRLSCCT